MELLKEYNLTSEGLKLLYNYEDFADDNYAEKFIDLLGDMYLVVGFHKMIKFQVLRNAAPVYFYNFTYDQGISFTKLMINTAMSGGFTYSVFSYYL